MAKTHITLRLDDKEIGILDKYQQDHGGTRTQAIASIILAYPSLQVKSEHQDLAKRIKENIPRESVMPDVCTYIDDIDLNRDAVHCYLKKAWMKADACKSCDRRNPAEDQQKMMVRCVKCKSLNQKERFCAYYGATMTEQTIKQDIPCEGYQRQ